MDFVNKNKQVNNEHEITDNNKRAKYIKKVFSILFKEYRNATVADF